MQYQSQEKIQEQTNLIQEPQVPLSTVLINKLLRAQPKSVAQSLLNCSQPEPKIDQASFPKPTSLVDLRNIQRLSNTKPTLDFKKAEYEYAFSTNISVYVKKILRALEVEGETAELVLPLPAPLQNVNATNLSEFMQLFIQDKIQALLEEEDVDMGYEHALTFTNAMTKYISSIKHPKMNTFDVQQFKTATQFIVKRQTLVKLLEDEAKYQKMSQVTPFSPQEIQPAKLVSEEQMSQMCSRLHADYKRNNQKLLERQRMKYEEELTNCTFKPAISAESRLYESDPSYGVDCFVEKRQIELKKIQENKIVRILNQIIEEAENFNIKLTDQFLMEVKQDLEATNNTTIQRDIQKKISDQLQVKYQELEKLNYHKKVKTGEIKKIKLNFEPNENTMVQTQLNKSRTYQNTLSNTVRAKQEKEEKAQEKWNAIESKINKANLRAEIFKEFRKNAIDLKIVEQRWGAEGLEAVLGQSAEQITEQEKSGVVTLYNCWK
ncbi:Conserved_hypothetical protein [Hexamita inflata]|uniref:Uncharacterized protein n=2 Tax=Hexamita inflata TaxID=28002 RepID=A0AA86QHW1_9EUKA|nr:Conserved hypothetical protein [Hexamita inflata]